MILLMVSLVLIIVVSIILYRLAMRVSLYKSGQEDDDSIRKNGKN